MSEREREIEREREKGGKEQYIANKYVLKPQFSVRRETRQRENGSKYSGVLKVLKQRGVQ